MYEIELKDGTRLGLEAYGGQVPYRYQLRCDAERSVRRVYPNIHPDDYEIVPARTVMEEKR
mgnify:CR=1 FL=1